MKYRVELNARVDMRYEIEVEAPDEDAAMELAVKNAPTEAYRWEQDCTTVSGVEADFAEEI
jgi:hypothetical protein